MSAMTDYLENKLVDWLLRAQAFTPPANVWVALFTAAPSDAGGGTEVTGGSYARVQIASSMANWSGTQAEGSTVASSGTGGLTSNNNPVTFPAPTGNWGNVTHFAIFDASSGGNMLLHGALSSTWTINSGNPAPQFNAAALDLTFA